MAKTNDNDVTLFFDFQNGFVGQSVALSINGKTVFEKNGIETKPIIGLAEQVKIGAHAGGICQRSW